jgi:hypothetical protein
MRLLFLLFLLLAFSTGKVAASEPHAKGWRDMLRKQQRIANAPQATQLSSQYPGLSQPMACLGEAFAQTAYPADVALGRKNFLTLVKNLGMEKPNPAELRQFLHPNKKPWDGYTGPTDGNCHMLFNSGTLNLTLSDGASKEHPIRKLAQKHLGIFTTQAHVKKLMKKSATTIRAKRIDTGAASADPRKAAEFIKAFSASWEKDFPREKLNKDDILFIEAVLPYTA